MTLFTGVLAVKNCEHIIDLTLRSTRHALDGYVIFDNKSTDDTREVIRKTADEYDLDVELWVEGGNSGRLYRRAIQRTSGYAVRLEGDQVYFEDRFSRCLNAASPGKLVIAQAYFIRNRLDLTRASQQANGPHSTIYPPDCDPVIRDGDHLPVADGLRPKRFDGPPISVNLNIESPAERLRNWHWRQSKWWSDEPPIRSEFRLRGYDAPYSESLTLDEYILLLREQGKGSAYYGIDGGTMDELGEDFVRWDIETNCAPYDGPLPDFVKQHRERFETFYV